MIRKVDGMSQKRVYFGSGNCMDRFRKGNGSQLEEADPGDSMCHISGDMSRKTWRLTENINQHACASVRQDLKGEPSDQMRADDQVEKRTESSNRKRNSPSIPPGILEFTS